MPAWMEMCIRDRGRRNCHGAVTVVLDLHIHFRRMTIVDVVVLIIVHFNDGVLKGLSMVFGSVLNRLEYNLALAVVGSGLQHISFAIEQLEGKLAICQLGALKDLGCIGRPRTRSCLLYTSRCV